MRAPATVERGRRSIGPKGREKFLEALASGWSIAHAAGHAGHGRQRFYELRDTDEVFASAWDNAYESGTDVLEDELRRRALGYDEETFDGEGKLIRRTRRHSDPSLIQALKARRPDRHRDNVARVELTGRDGGPVELEANYAPTTLRDVLALARELGIDDLDDVVDGEASEVAEIEAGES